MNSSTGTNDIAVLNGLIKKSRELTAPSQLLPEELSVLASSFITTRDPSYRSKAFLALSVICQKFDSPAKEDSNGSPSDTNIKLFEPIVTSRLMEIDEQKQLVGTSFLTALFQVNWQIASAIFMQDGVLDSIMDGIDLIISPVLYQNVAHLFGQACGHKPCRTIMSSQSIQWLELQCRQAKGPILQAAAAVALVKYSKGIINDTPDVTEDQVKSDNKYDDLAAMMKSVAISGKEEGAAVDAIEGLAYLSTNPIIKEMLSKDPVFLRKLFTLVRNRNSHSDATHLESNSATVYGAIVIIQNLCAYRPKLSEEQKQLQKLQRMAKAGKSGENNVSESQDTLDDDGSVTKRIKRLVDAGVLSVLRPAILASDSVAVRANVSKTLLSILDEKENRGKVLQAGGGKLLGNIIKKTLENHPQGSKLNLEMVDLVPIQALAKLSITSSPMQVFGPDIGLIYDAIRPFSLLLQHPASTLLQQFEAMMALTNLSSYDAGVAERIAKLEGLMNKVELLLFGDHVLVRRAAMELVCNLIAGSDEVFDRYGGGEKGKGGIDKLHLLLALSDVDDLPTKLAASGALATLTTSASACQSLLALQVKNQRVLVLLTQLIDPTSIPPKHRIDDSIPEKHPGLLHRGIICVRNLLVGIRNDEDKRKLAKEAKEVGLIQALLGVVKDVKEDAILQPTGQALKIMIDLN